MKKIAYILSVIAICSMTASCAKELSQEETSGKDAEEVVVPEGYVLKTFELGQISKTQLDGQSVKWEAGDLVTLLWGTEGATAEGIVTIDEKGNATLTAAVEEAPVYWAVYPASAEAAVNANGTAVNVTVANTGSTSFKDVNYMCARTSAEEMSLHFQHICFYVAITKPAGIYTSTLMTAGSHVAGTVPVSFEDGEITVGAATDNKSTTLAAVTDPAEAVCYYALLPNVEVEGGFGIRYNPDAERKTSFDGEWYPMVVSDKTFTTFAGGFLNLGTSINDYFSYDYFVSPTGTGKGRSWEDAASIDSVVEMIKTSGNFYAAQSFNRHFHFMEGTYRFSVEVKSSMNTKYFFDGGYSSTSSGTSLDAKSGDTPTVFAVPDTKTNAYVMHFNDSKTRFECADITFTNIDAMTQQKPFVCVRQQVQKFTNCKFTNANKTAAASGNVTGGCFTMNTTSADPFVNASVTLKDCSFTDNKSTENAGAVYLNDVRDTCVIDHCTFTGNSGTNGGALNSNAIGKIVIKNNSLFKENNSTSNAAAASIYGNYIHIEDTEFDGNESKMSGGAIRLGGSPTHCEVNTCTFRSNKLSAAASDKAFYGSAILINTTSPVYVNDSEFRSNANTNTGASGGLFGSAQNVTANLFVNNCFFYDNQTAYQGGAVLLSTASYPLNAYFTNCSFHGDKAGGTTSYGIEFTANAGFLGVHNCTITQNTTGATNKSYISVNAGKFLMFNSTVIGTSGNNTTQALVRLTNSDAATMYAANNICISGGTDGTLKGSAIGGASATALRGTSKGYNYVSASTFSVNDDTDTDGLTRTGLSVQTASDVIPNRYYNVASAGTLANKAAKAYLESVFSAFDTANNISNGATFLSYLKEKGVWGKDQLGNDRGTTGWWAGAYQGN